MIRHIVMWRIKDDCEGKDKRATALLIKEELESMIGKIDGLRSLEVGINVNTSPAAFDLVLITEHSTLSDLQFYQEHPAHLAVGAFVKNVTKERVVVDYGF
ncbi:MAG: Dabb family protein [Bacteroidales bacterium]|nr:Dabb family protein [Bacteroidales bacterium]